MDGASGANMLGGASERHRTDPRPYRATYGVRYPDSRREFNTKQDLEPLKGKDGAKFVVSDSKLFWTVSGATVSKVVFRGCNFHTTHGQVPTQMSSLTFEHCDFTTCFMGFMVFHRTHFRNCTFVRCEMSRTEFDECSFDGCTFKECTPWESIFQNTLIDPFPFDNGFLVAEEHLAALSAQGRDDIAIRHKRARVELAEQLLRSNEERRHAIYADRALYLSRKASIAWRAHELGAKKGTAWIASAPSFAASWAFLHLTKGGTSLLRLLVLASFACLFVSLVLNVGVLDARVAGLPAESLSFAQCFSAAISLFLAFGFGSFSAVGWGPNALITLIPILGLAWSALVLAVIVRRAYR